MKRKIVASLTVICLTFSVLTAAFPCAAEPSREAEQVNKPVTALSDKEIVLDAKALSAGAGTFTSDGQSVLIAEEDSLTVEFSADAGQYEMKLEYDPIPGRSRDVELDLELNGGSELQADSIILMRRWRDKGRVIETDFRGNDIRPSQEEVLFEERGWLCSKASDSTGYTQGAILFSLSDSNSLKITLAREGVRLHRIVFIPKTDVPDYAEYSKQYKDVPDAEKSLPVIEAELPLWKNDARLVAFADRSSPLTSPYKGSKESLNTIGGENWVNAGQTLCWQFTPEQTGMYEIRLRSRQNYVQGFYSARTLNIDGEIPFKEAENLRFTYNSRWENYVVSAGDTACRFYFEKGRTYELSLTVTLGDFAEILGRAQESVLELNDIYRELLMIVGSSPDAVRDYNLDKVIPDTIENMLKEAGNLKTLVADIKEISGMKGSELALPEKLAKQLESFHKDPKEIAKRMHTFKDNIAALNTWILDARTLPLDIDTITVAAPGEELASAHAGFFSSLKYTFLMFLASFTEDYNTLGSEDKSGEMLTVWTTSGRDQASVLNDLIRSGYAPKTKERLGKQINVNLQVISADAILPSVAAGNGADVLLNAASSLPVNYATRRAAYNLRDAASDGELSEVLSRFRESALVPLEFEGGLYGLPEQQTWPVLFYRSDILSELQIPEPNLENPWSWDDLIRYLPVLQKKNMSVLMDTGIPAGTEALGTFAMFLYQNGGEFYENGGEKSALDSEVSISAFKKWTQYYTNYGLPVNFSIANRFRTGESPIVISDMNLYNQLVVSAPEINGLWGIGLVPGTVKPDGTIDHSVSSGGTACMLLSTIKNPKAGFDFISWWTGTETQMSFASEMESLLGTSARYPSANVEVMEQLSWSLRDLDVLMAQAEWAKGIPEVPGGYYTARHIKNAFREVCVGTAADDPREVLIRYAKIINDELYDKRLEFGLK